MPDIDEPDIEMPYVDTPVPNCITVDDTIEHVIRNAGNFEMPNPVPDIPPDMDPDD